MKYVRLVEPLYKTGLLNDKMEIPNLDAIFDTYSRFESPIMEIVKLNDSARSSGSSAKDNKIDIEQLNKTRKFFKTIPHGELVLFGPKAMNSRAYDARDNSKFYKEATRLLNSNENIVTDKIVSIVKKIKKPGSFIIRRSNVEPEKAAEMIDDLFSERIKILGIEIENEANRREALNNAKKDLVASLPDFRPNIPLFEYIVNRFNEEFDDSQNKTTIKQIKTNFDIATWMESIVISSEKTIETIFKNLYSDTKELANLCN